MTVEGQTVRQVAPAEVVEVNEMGHTLPPEMASSEVGMGCALTLRLPPPEISPEISREFPGNVQDISRKFPGHFPDISRKFPGHFREISGKIAGHFQNISRKFPRNFPTFPGHFRNILGNSLDIYRKFLPSPVLWKADISQARNS